MEMSWKHTLWRLYPFARPRGGRGLLSQAALQRALDRERGRSERTGREFSLVTFGLPAGDERARLLPRLARGVRRRARYTDAVGWLDADRLGVVLPDTAAGGARRFADETAKRLAERGWPVSCAVYVFGSQWGAGGGGPGAGSPADDEAPGGAAEAGAPDERLDPLLAARIPLWKRATDVVISAAALVVLAPLMLVAALLVKITSPGPVIFRQVRIGRAGRPFTLLKLRSMSAASDASAHRRHLAGLIRSDRPMAKLEDDPRVFPLGAFLRRTCVDELPQLVNVLRGEMSLVGPRPCLPYEAEEYARWHARRFDLAPGMTGLWQVSGKNALSFPEMVRLDIAYARRLSPWLDFKILLRTPLTVLAGLLPRRGGAEGGGQ